VKNLSKLLITAVLYFIALVTISGLGFVLRKEVPKFAGAVIADAVLILALYSTLLKTIKGMNELEKVGLENQKLQLEIAEKETAKSRQAARIVVPTSDDIEKYSKRSAARGTGIVVLGALLLVSVSLMNRDIIDREIQLSPIGAAKRAFPPVSATCDTGNLKDVYGEFIVFSDKDVPEKNLRLIISGDHRESIDLIYRQTNAKGERVFLGVIGGINVSSFSTGEIQRDDGRVLTRCVLYETQGDEIPAPLER
jgi:hypothetical protein